MTARSLLLFVCFPGVTTNYGCIFTARQRALASSCSKFLDHTQRRATVGRAPLDEWSVRRRDLYLITQHSQQTNIHAPGGFEPTISAGERPKTYALDRVAIGTGRSLLLVIRVYILNILQYSIIIKFYPQFSYLYAYLYLRRKKVTGS
jgi:hypothetical protein